MTGPTKADLLAEADERGIDVPSDATKDEVAALLSDGDRAPFYCPGCGRQWNFQTECRGRTDAEPHAPIEVVSTDELDGDPDDHTAAPNTGEPG